MKKVYFLLIMLLLFQTNKAIGQLEVEPEKAVLAALNELYLLYPDDSHYVVSVSTYERFGRTLLYEIHTKEKSVFVSGSRDCLPILAVVGNDMDPILQDTTDNIPDGLRFFIDRYAEQNERSFRSGTYYGYNDREWRIQFDFDSLLMSPCSDYVLPLLKSQWGQSKTNDGVYSYAYNYYIPGPPIGSCDHCKVGCVGVALGQLLYYYKNPFSKIYENGQYDWCNMPDRIMSTSPNYDAEKKAVAKLLADCAASVNSIYGCDVTTSTLLAAESALKHDWGYNRDLEFMFQENHSEAWWTNELKNELRNGHPVLYAGAINMVGGDGHAFVCDGFDCRGRFHFNWGWRGNNNGYCAINNIHSGTSDTTYDHWLCAIFYAYPDSEKDFCTSRIELDEYYEAFSHFPGTVVPYGVDVPLCSRLYSASTASPVSWRTIVSGQTEVYTAINEIVLQDGFEAGWGSDFTAEIVPCPACEEPGFVPIYPNFDSLFPLTQTGGDSIDVVGDATYSHMADFGISRAEVFPNPTTGELTVVTDGMAEAIVVYNAAGQPVGGWDIASQGETWLTLDFPPSLPQGTYIVVLRTKTGTSAARVVRQ